MIKGKVLHRLRVGTLLLMGGFGVMGGGLLAPALPAFLGPFDVGEGSVGLVLSVYTFAAALTLPFTGLLMDLLGRKAVGVSCLVIDGTFGLLCIVAPNFTLLLVLRFFQGIGIAGLIPVAMTVVSDWYEGGARLRIIGFLSGTVAVAGVVIPLIGGVLADLDWRYPFAVYGFSLLLAPVFLILIPESAPKPQMSDIRVRARVYLGGLRKALMLKTVREVFLQSLGTYFLLYALVTFVPLFLAGFYGIRTGIAGVAIALNGFVAAVVATQAVGIDRLLGKRMTLVLGYGLIAISLISIPLWPSAYGVGVSLLLFGFGMGINQPVIFNWATTAGPPALTGSVVALFNTMKFIGMTLAPLLLRVVHDIGGAFSTFTAAGFVAALWAMRSLLRSESGY